MIKGGYKIVNFNGAALSGVAETLPGIYDQIVDDYDKPVMVSGVSLNGDIMDDAYAGVQEKIAGDLSKSVELTVYGGIITVTEDDEVTFATAKSNTELTADVNALLNDPNITTPSLATTNYVEILSGLTVGKCAFVAVSPSLNNLVFTTNRSGTWLVRKTTETEVDIVAYTATDKYIYKARYSVTNNTFSSKFVFEGTELT